MLMVGADGHARRCRLFAGEGLGASTVPGTPVVWAKVRGGSREARHQFGEGWTLRKAFS